MRKWTYLLLMIMVILMIPTAVFAQDEAAVAQLQANLDTVWVLLAAFLVFFMQAGFAMVEAGFTRAKNASNIIMKSYGFFNRLYRLFRCRFWNHVRQ